MSENKFEVEMQRSGVTPAEFLSYVRRSVDKKGGRELRGDLDLRYFRAGNDLNFDTEHDGIREKSVSKPYEMQTYIRNADGSVYNEICEFEFDDDKTGHGYYYLVNVIPAEEIPAEEIPAEELENALAAEAAEEIREEVRAAGPVVVREFTTKTKSYRVLDVFGYEIPCEISKTGKPGKIERDARRVFELLAAGPDKLTPSERLELLRIYNVAFHESGKIEGIFSLDSSATNCAFCRKMREYAAAHPEKQCICGSCYDVRQEGFKLAALARHTLNLIIMSATVYSREELATVPVYGLTRVNSSGDSSGDVYAENMVLFAAAHPACRVTAWAKNTAGYIRACRKHGKPENLLLICSSPFIDKTAPLPEYFDYTFTVYSTPEKIREALAAGAMECNGKKCRECGYSCYTGAWPEGSNIAELLRK